jgi:hypothetical protein
MGSCVSGKVGVDDGDVVYGTSWGATRLMVGDVGDKEAKSDVYVRCGRGYERLESDERECAARGGLISCSGCKWCSNDL